MGDKPKHPVRLTNKFVEALPPGVMFWDDDRRATGFGVRTYPGGGKSFFVDYRIAGRQRRYTIGPFPRWSAEAAANARMSCASGSTVAKTLPVRSASAGKPRRSAI
jgi:hypothetical protein